MYNLLLRRCREAYKREGTSLHSKYVLCAIIKELKEANPKFDAVFSQVLQNCADRLSKAYADFFRRLRERRRGGRVKLGFPRYKKRFKSITYPQFGFKFLSDKRLRVSKIGSIPIVLHRVPKGGVKNLTIKRNRAGQWFAVFACEALIPKAAQPHPEAKVGIDVGLENFATLHTGERIENPRFLVKSERKLKRLQRKMSGKAKGSANRRKAIRRVARLHVRIANQRRDFLHQQSRLLVNKYGFIAAEDLRIGNMLQNHHLAKHVSDASWGKFLRMLSYKAESAGGRFAENPHTIGSSKRCSSCGAEMAMALSDRIFECSNCGFVAHRDVNSALNHLKDTAGLAGIQTPAETAASTPNHNDSGASEVAEPGTTRSDSHFH